MLPIIWENSEKILSKNYSDDGNLSHAIYRLVNCQNILAQAEERWAFSALELIPEAVLGLEGVIVEVVVDVCEGLPGMNIVGLPDKAVQESRNRVQAVVKSALEVATAGGHNYRMFGPPVAAKAISACSLHNILPLYL